ncbi:4-hydroxyproline epimerase [Pelomonas cellulosilytica]|uniref:4-hydroxyproline epimerase n=1 Tax=Pelomonas cellulosilytica TaxID=2906762 RepID=A0ABS8XUN1_9BURK|nr:4-hydroxyproline epimerase [Pelomonas sp. P8]
MKRIHVIDSHTGGEPTRVVTAGFPDLGSGSMAERRDRLAGEHDRFRRATLLEPRGSDVLVGALLCAPQDPAHTAGVIFFNNAGYLGMCGHGTIGLVATLAHLGQIQPGEHVIETPVGDVRATLHDDGRVSVRNVPAWRLAADVTVTLPTGQLVTGDIAWGGNWFFLCADHGQVIAPERVGALIDYAGRLAEALNAQGHRGAGGAAIDHIELFAEADPALADSRSFVLCPGGEYDRSPCGTGTSAKLACLAARGKLAPGHVWRQASVIGSVFEGWYEAHAAEAASIVPTIRGQAFINAEATLLINPADPFGWGLASA